MSIVVTVVLPKKKGPPGIARPKVVTTTLTFLARDKPTFIDLWGQLRDYMLCAESTDTVLSDAELPLADLPRGLLEARPWTGEAAALRTRLIEEWNAKNQHALDLEIGMLEERLRDAKRRRVQQGMSSEF